MSQSKEEEINKLNNTFNIISTSINNLKIIFEYLELKFTSGRGKGQDTISKNNETIIILLKEIYIIEKYKEISDNIVKEITEIKEILNRNSIDIKKLINKIQEIIKKLEENEKNISNKITEIEDNLILEIKETKLNNLIIKRTSNLDLFCDDELYDIIKFYMSEKQNEQRICKEWINDKDSNNIHYIKKYIKEECFNKIYNLYTLEFINKNQDANELSEIFELKEIIDNYEKKEEKKEGKKEDKEYNDKNDENIYFFLINNYLLRNNDSIDTKINFYYFKILKLLSTTKKIICDKTSKSYYEINQFTEFYDVYIKLKKYLDIINNEHDKVEITNIIKNKNEKKDIYENYLKKFELTIGKNKEEMINRLKYYYLEKNNDNLIFNSILLFQYFDKDIDIIIPILLWLDSMHDFTSSRLNSEDKIELNKNEKENFKNYYMNLFFIINDKYYNKDTGKGILKDFKKEQKFNISFSIECDNSILKIVYNKYKSDNNLAKILYFISNKLKESKFFYSYIIYFFIINKCNSSTDILNKLKKYININPNIDYKLYNILWTNIPEIQKWNVDYGKESKINILDQSKKIFIPASLIDANKLNSIDFYKHYDTSYTDFTLWSGLNFNYIYNKNMCHLIVNSTGINHSYIENNQIKSDINYIIHSHCDLNFGYDNISSKNNFFIKNNQNKILPLDSSIKIKNIKEIIYSDKQSGPSVNSLYNLIKLLEKNNNLDLGLIDSLLSLKRIGDLGQIVQSKLSNIPFYTDDKMEALISIALCCSTITSIGDYMIWYNNENDSLKSLLTYESKINSDKDCINYDTQRKDSDNYIKNLNNISWLGDAKLIKKINNNYCIKNSCSI